MASTSGEQLEQERAVTVAVAERRDELVALASALIRYDTTAGDPAEPGREEAALQQLLESRLRAAGAETDLWEPDPAELEPSRRQVPDGLTFAGRPQLLARFRGTSGASMPSLMLNGHIDVVSVEPRSRWTHPPFDPVERDGALYGRGACDMKGGVACVVLACEVLANLGIPLGGDLVVSLVTDEETSGAGAMASALRGAKATAGIVPEPTGFQVWTSSRGSLLPRITVCGRPGHAEVEQPPWRDGGAVNAIEKARIVADALERLRVRWRRSPRLRHPRLGRPDLVPTMIHGGEWVVSHPASCLMAYDVTYLPAQADSDGWGTLVEEELVGAVLAAAADDDWLAAHPPVVSWGIDVPPGDLAAAEPIVRLALGLADVVGRGVEVAARSAWHDGVTFTRFGTPCIAFGPGELDHAHAVDEHVAVDDLVRCAQGLAVAALRFAGQPP